MRLLPITMVIAFLLLGLKIGVVAHGGKKIVVSLTENARASSEPSKATDALEAKPEEAKKEPEKKEESSKEEKKDEKKDDKKEETKGEGDPKVTPPSADGSGDTEEEEVAKHEFSQVELDLLQSLAKRREELDEWSKQVQLKENMLEATEGRISEKVNNLQKMKKEVEDLLAKYNEQEDLKIKSLVKIYENMKPKDAARIFEELDMPVLLMVVDKMSERKVSPILAAMNPTKAKDLTIQLAEQRKLQKHSSALSQPQTPPPAANGR